MEQISLLPRDHINVGDRRREMCPHRSPTALKKKLAIKHEIIIAEEKFHRQNNEVHLLHGIQTESCQMWT